MLTSDLVRVRRKGDELHISPLTGKWRKRAHALTETWLELARAHEGETREAFDDACKVVDYPPSERKLALGLRKLVLDRCTFETPADVDPAALRAEVFGRAALVRRQLGEGESFDRDAVLAAVAEARGSTPDEVERVLFADLKQAQRMNAFDDITTERMVDAYELGQAQAVLLKAVHVSVRVQCEDPAACRRLFRKMKFLRLMHSIHRDDEAWRIEIDGPFSLFSSVTRYGLQLALLLPALRGCTAWSLEADVRWGKEKTPLTFRLDQRADVEVLRDESASPRLADDVVRLVERIRALDTPWRVRTSTALLDLPGVGVCVPDLVFTHKDTSQRVYLEVMGFWSRAAVWKRVELVEAGLKQRIVFAVSRRLRVSEAVLDEEASAALYVYKGTINARGVLDRVEAIAGTVGGVGSMA